MKMVRYFNINDKWQMKKQLLIIFSFLLFIALFQQNFAEDRKSSQTNSNFRVSDNSSCKLFLGLGIVDIDNYFRANNTDMNVTKDSVHYYSNSKINLYVGYNSSVDYSLSYFPYKKYKYFVNLNYQYFTSFSHTKEEADFGLVNEFGINSFQVYYKIGLIYFLRRNIYIGTNLGLGFTFPIRGNILNDILMGIRFEIKNDIYIQTEGGVNNLIKLFGNDVNPFIKIGIGFNY